MAENTTNLILEIFQSFDAGEFFFSSSNFPSLLTGLFHVVSLIGTVVLSGI